MSRRIDVTNPEGLSEVDRKYLQSRGRTDLIDQADRLAKVDAAHDRVTTPVVRRKPVNMEVEEVDEPYEEWRVDELKNECRNRQIPADGTKAELVARLEAHDANAVQ